MPDQRALQGLDFMRERIEEMERQLAKAKEAANAFAEAAGLPPPYALSENGIEVRRRVRLVRPDQFAGCTTPGAAARAYLNWRGPRMGAASVEEIYEALHRGGYSFDANMSSSINGLRIALGKDKSVVRLANNYYGLEEWYAEPGSPTQLILRRSEAHNPAYVAAQIYRDILETATHTDKMTFGKTYRVPVSHEMLDILSTQPGIVSVTLGNHGELLLSVDKKKLTPL